MLLRACATFDDAEAVAESPPPLRYVIYGRPLTPKEK